jgi:hypothetical protein
MKEASSILCVGAGPTGLESAGYLKEFYPEKKIGICQRGAKLLPVFEGAHEMISGIFKKLGVEVHTGTSFSEDNKMGYEFILDCRGFKYLGPTEYMQGSMAECIDKKSGQIWVDSKGRVTNKHPIASNHNPSQLKVHKNIFSYGDVCLTP